jgi:hypothetical protein
MDFGGVESRGWVFEVGAFLAAEARPRSEGAAVGLLLVELGEGVVAAADAAVVVVEDVFCGSGYSRLVQDVAILDKDVLQVFFSLSGHVGRLLVSFPFDVESNCDLRYP